MFLFHGTLLQYNRRFVVPMTTINKGQRACCVYDTAVNLYRTLIGQKNVSKEHPSLTENPLDCLSIFTLQHPISLSTRPLLCKEVTTRDRNIIESIFTSFSHLCVYLSHSIFKLFGYRFQSLLFVELP